MKHAVLPDPAHAEAIPALAALSAPRTEATPPLLRPRLLWRVEMEAVWEARRRAHAPDYAVRRHVLVLSALLAERAALEG